MKTLGIVAHSAEGAALCFTEACRHGGRTLGEFMHPRIVMSAVPMALSMPAWESGDHAAVARHLAEGVLMVARAGAEFFICPDNTAHIVLEEIGGDPPIPGLHIAEVVAAEIARHGWGSAGLLGTRWTMTGPVYERVLADRGIEKLIPDDPTRDRINDAIFAELCNGTITPETTAMFLRAARDLQDRGADCVILGCTEIPMVITPENSPEGLACLDSTRLLARRAVDLCVEDKPLAVRDGWIEI